MTKNQAPLARRLFDWYSYLWGATTLLVALGFGMYHLNAYTQAQKAIALAANIAECAEAAQDQTGMAGRWNDAAKSCEVRVETVVGTAFYMPIQHYQALLTGEALAENKVLSIVKPVK